MMDKEKNQKLGDKKFKEGKSNVTTGVFQWSKDYSSGASNFSEAVKYFQSAGNLKKTIDALKELIVCNQKMLDNWAVARNYQEMLDIYLKGFPETSIEILKEVAYRGFEFFRMAQSTDKGLQLLNKLSKHLSNQGNKKESIAVLQKAYEMSAQDEKSFKKKELFHQIIQTMVDGQGYVEVERMYKEIVQKQKTHDSQQHGLIVLIMILLQHEAKRAEKEMYELSNHISDFLGSDQCQAADQLIKAYKKGDEAAFFKWTTKAAVTSIYPVNIIGKLRNLKLPVAQPQQAEGQDKEQNENLNELLF